MSEEPVLAAQTRLMTATEPKELLNMSLPKLEDHYDSLHEVRGRLNSWGYSLIECDARLNLLRQEIELKRADCRHEQMMRLGRKTLFWAIVAGIGTIGLLLLDIPFSKLLPSKASPALPTSSTPTPTASPPATPTATILPSPTPQASPMPSPSVAPG